MLKVRTGWVGWLEKCRVIPAGKDSTISPVIFTTHLGRREAGGRGGKSDGGGARGTLRLPKLSLLAGIRAFEVGVDGFGEGSRHWESVLGSHGDGTGSSGASCWRATNTKTLHNSSSGPLLSFFYPSVQLRRLRRTGSCTQEDFH